MLTRRDLLRVGLGLGVAHAALTTIPAWAAPQGDVPARLRLALLHMASVPGDFAANRAMLERGLAIAAQHGADVLLTPELALSGYEFRAVLGLDWIPTMPDPWLRNFGRKAGRLGITPVIGTPDRDADGNLRNAMLVLGPDGNVVGSHWKINVIPDVVEGWAVPGTDTIPVDVHGIPTGLLICADSYNAKNAAQAARLGARLLLSSAAWMPGEMGPQGIWEARTRETGLPLVVCNRTSIDPSSDASRSRSVGVINGVRTFSYHSAHSHVLLVDLIGEELAPRLVRALPLPA